MILILVNAAVPEENRTRFLELAARHAEVSRAEPGCRAFDVYESPVTRGELRFVEEYETAQDVDAHFASAHMARFMDEALPLLSASTVRRFEARELT